MKYYVIIDTNVIVSALYTTNNESSTVKVIKELYRGKLIPLYSDDIIEEYKEVLNRPKLNLKKVEIGNIINAIYETGIKINPQNIEIDMKDKDDIMFYALVMDKTIINGKYLITGNKSDFPINPIIVSPEEFMEIYYHNS